MSHTSSNNDLIRLIKELNTEDIVWLLHVINKDIIEEKLRVDISDHDNELVEWDIEKLNSLKDLNELKTYLIHNLKDESEATCEFYINLINNYKKLLMIRSRDFSNYKTDKRLLNFATYKISSEKNDIYRKIKSISNIYLRFLYIIFTRESYYRSNIRLDRIESDYSKIISEKSLHFKKYDIPTFYKWAKNNIEKDRVNFREFNQVDFIPLQDNDFSVWVNSIFDIMYHENQHAYLNLKKKLSNAWYQKDYQKRNKGKENHFFLTDSTKNLLKILALKLNRSEDKVIELLINKFAIEEGIIIEGIIKYSA
ncbi:hypothetical protein V6C59_03375 [Acinetobacter bereziniae]|uniref:hypothetical protein n=1 Tax=Acinetobacter bereziniae TaxID=106648 RepID=UPI002FD93640